MAAFDNIYLNLNMTIFQKSYAIKYLIIKYIKGYQTCEYHCLNNKFVKIL
jgi:hypothetical protein